MAPTPLCFSREVKPETKPVFASEIVDIPEKWNKDVVTYSVVRGSDDLPKDSAERIAVNLACTTWEAECNLKLKYVKADQNPDITVAWLYSEEDELFKSDSTILAYGGYPGTIYQGVLRLNDDKEWSWAGGFVPIIDADGTKHLKYSYNLNQTLRHEMGHVLGLSHSDDTCPKCVMYPTYNDTLELQPLDIQRIRAKYGERAWRGNWYMIFKRAIYNMTRRKPQTI